MLCTDTKYFTGDGSWGGVEEQGDEGYEEEQEEDLQYEPFVALPNDELQGFARVHEPQEGWVWTAE